MTIYVAPPNPTGERLTTLERQMRRKAGPTAIGGLTRRISELARRVRELERREEERERGCEREEVA